MQETNSYQWYGLGGAGLSVFCGSIAVAGGMNPMMIRIHQRQHGGGFPCGLGVRPIAHPGTMGVGANRGENPAVYRFENTVDSVRQAL